MDTLTQEQRDYEQSYQESLTLWPIPFTQYYVETSYGQTYVIESGKQDGPPLVLLHGASMSSTMWYPNIAAWSKEYRIYAVDIMGDKNKSLKEKEFTNRQTHAEWLKEVFIALRIEKADIVALSYGALNAVNFMLHEPQYVNRAVLMSPAETFVSFDPAFYGYAFGMVQNREGVNKFINWLFEDRYEMHPFIQNQLEAAMMWVDTKRSSKPASSGFPYVFTDEELQSLQAPILLLLGENEVMYNPQQAMERAKNTVPQIEVELVEGAGHVLSMEKSIYASERTLAFLKADMLK